jgi:hypothetical protein
VGKVAALLDLEQEIVTRSGRYPDTVQVRSALCYWAAHDLGIRTLELAKRLGVSQPTASQSVKRGKRSQKRIDSCRWDNMYTNISIPVWSPIRPKNHGGGIFMQQ